MKELFITKLNNNEYISNYLYQNICTHFPSIIPNNFNIDIYNEKVLKKEYLKYKSYFANMYKEIDPNIKLDIEQIKAILADEDYSLIIAGAGCGKTTTMASKVKYLVDIKKIDPTSIVVMSFTKKATAELEKRIVLDFNIPANVTTFHSLGLTYIRQIFSNRKCYVVDDNTRNEIFLNYFKEKIFPYKNKVKELLELFNATTISREWVFAKYFQENYDKYPSFAEYFLNYKKDKIASIQNIEKEVKERLEKELNKEEAVFTINKELVKSKKEAIIANYLFCNNIEYQYERIYENILENNRTYKPDFTLNLNGDNVYLEYFGLSNYTKFEINKYNKIRHLKEEYHLKHHNKYIALDDSDDKDLINHLKISLLQMGFTLKPKSYVEIYENMLDKNPTSQFYPYKNFLYNCIDKIKSSSKREQWHEVINAYLKNLPSNEKEASIKQFNYIKDFYKYYQQRLYASENYGFDFSDMIYYAKKYLNNITSNNSFNYKYIIIDEYQDISAERYELTKQIASRCHAKVVAVGDDWQSIFAFTGSKIEYIYNFQKYFIGAKIFKINNTYRNSQELINYTGKFIMKNKKQIKKNLLSPKSIKNPIRFVLFKENEEYQALKQLILKIHNAHPRHSIMVLARSNNAIDLCFEDSELKDDVGTKITYKGYEDIDIDGMTIHKSKGLTCDEVILIGLNQSFPHNEYGLFWLESLFQPKISNEPISFAEERRIFYVGLTRTKNYVYLLVNENIKLRSPFIQEIYNIVNKRESL